MPTNLSTISLANAQDITTEVVRGLIGLLILSNLSAEDIALLGDLVSTIEGSFICPGGGTVDIVVTDGGTIGTIDQGDVITGLYDDCDLADAQGTEIDGMIVTTFTTITGTQAGNRINPTVDWDFTLDTVFTNVRYRINFGELIDGDGSLSSMVVYDDASGDFTATTSIANLDGNAGLSGCGEITDTGPTIITVTELGNDSYSIDFGGVNSIASDGGAIDGGIALTSIISITGDEMIVDPFHFFPQDLDGANSPVGGAFTITGDSGNIATDIGGGVVSLDVDESSDADGMSNGFVMPSPTWADLRN